MGNQFQLERSPKAQWRKYPCYETFKTRIVIGKRVRIQSRENSIHKETGKADGI